MDKGGNGGLIPATKAEPLPGLAPFGFGHELLEAGGNGRFLAAPRQQQQQWGGGGVVEQIGQQVEGGAVGPVEIIQQPDGSGEGGLQQLGHALEEAGLGGGGGEGGGGGGEWGVGRSEVGEEAG